MAGSAFSQLGSNAVFRLIKGAELVDFALGGCVDFRDEIADAEGVHFPTETDLRGNLVAFRDGDVAHVVADAGDLQVARGVPATRGAGPGGEALVDFRVLPVADDGLARQAQARADVPELAAAVGGLVQVHEIHVDLAPREVAVELGVQVGKRLAEDLQAFDPHLRRGKRVHPGDDADAVFFRVRVDGELGDLGG